MMKALAAPLLLLASLSACATLVPSGGGPVVAAPGAELVGRQVRLETSSGQVSTLHFAGDGTVQARFGSSKVSGTWVATRGQLCFSWSRASRECWPYTAPLRRGETVRLTSDRGNVVRVTLL